ncbi:MAG: HNH endonuclease [Pseudohongiella sp.]|nr:HNH endonuclease [Pseudohongiella sp.]
MPTFNHTHITSAAFERISWLERLYGDDIPWNAIEHGFDLQNERILLGTKAEGIFKPRQMQRGVLSIKTTKPRPGRDNIYDDQETTEGFFRYELKRGHPKQGSNRYLWEAMEDGMPFVYFHAIAPGRYKAIWPCFVTKIHEAEMFCEVVVGDSLLARNKNPSAVEYPLSNAPARAYAVRETRVRLHQATFRANVLSAYKNRCALSGLPLPELLEAAHITPDTFAHSSTEVSNGITMTRLHHRAYDSNLIGITSEFKIVVGRSIKEQSDIPILSMLKKLDGGSLVLPKELQLQPNRDRLAERFNEFLLQN